MERFPAEPERFVGRAGAMAAASAALAPGSGRTAVLLHGMAGAGKTACALELAYRHQDSFAAAAFWQAPTSDDEFGGALAEPGRGAGDPAGRVRVRDDRAHRPTAALAAFLPRLRSCWRTSGVLLVLDNLETLLTPGGAWRDPRLGAADRALTGHDGESRVILTSRIPPAGLGAGVLALPVHALSLAEAVGAGPGAAEPARACCTPTPARSAPVDADAVAADRDRVRRVLQVVQGHPKLMELADAAAADPDRLDAQLAAAETAAGGQGAGGVLPRRRQPPWTPAQFLDALTAWTSQHAGRAARTGPADGPVRRLPGRRRPAIRHHRGELGGPVAAARPAR